MALSFDRRLTVTAAALLAVVAGAAPATTAYASPAGPVPAAAPAA
ncbi:peptidase M15, partial [Streptomyces bambusae]|nr:peptidase M15 [Streptomyces bambusae]